MVAQDEEDKLAQEELPVNAEDIREAVNEKQQETPIEIFSNEQVTLVSFIDYYLTIL
jgi:hypothetical protein